MGFNPFSDAAQGAVKGFGEAIATAVGAFKADPTKVAELEAAITQATIQAQASMAASVSAAMVAEAGSEHWLQYSWRPMGAYIFYLLVIHNFVLASYFAHLGLVHLDIPEAVWYTFTALIGVTAYTRVMNQVEQTKAAATNGKS